METNPYQSPTTVDAPRDSLSAIKLVGRGCVFLYGVLFSIFCVAGTIDDIQSREPIIETAFWIAMSVLMCYGVFALAVRRLRIRQLAPFWRYFAYALPVLTYLGAAWDIYQQPPMPPIEFVAVLILFILLTTPGLVFNWMLRHRLSRGRNFMA